MKTSRVLRIFLVLFVFFAIGCGRTAEPELGGNTNLNPNPPGGGPVPFGPVQSVFNLFATGSIPNSVVVKGNYLYVVNSGSNNLQRINLDNGTVDFPFVTLPSGANPWDMSIVGSTGYISNFVANNISVVNLLTGQVTDTIQGNGNGGFNDPEGLAIAANGLLFVGNADFDPFFNQGPGFVTVIDTATGAVVNQIPTTQKNPQFVTAIGNTVYVTNSGSGIFDLGCSCFLPVTNGGVDIIDATTAATAIAPTANIEIPLDPTHPTRGFPGVLATVPGTTTAYIGSNSGILYKMDVGTQTLLRGNDDPIIVTPDSSDNLIRIKIDTAGIKWISSFNTDQVFLMESNSDTILSPAISVDSDPSNLEGPLDIAFDPNGHYPDAYVLMSVSEEITALYTN